MNIVLDADSFFLLNYYEQNHIKKRRNFINIDSSEEPSLELFEQYYLGLRSSFFICEDSVENKFEAENVMKKYREDCANIAMGYMKKYVESKLYLPIDFIWFAREAIIKDLKKEFSKVENIKLQLSMKARISAISINQNVIKIPALIRAVLMHCNLAIINSINDVMDEPRASACKFDRKQIARFIFPYLIYCHDDFSVQNLPMFSARTEDSIKTAFGFTNLQIVFIVAHEYAHILLKHFDDDDKPNYNKEKEADLFALRSLLKYVKENDSYSKKDVLAAVRWLFKFQLLEERIGALTRGEKNDYYESGFEKRRSNFQDELFEATDLKGSTIFESIGFAMIVELQKILDEFGVELVNDIIETFHKSEYTGRIEPWWERITEK